jgi:hypothetical protein
VIVEDCSTSWSSDDDNERSTTSSLDKVDDDASSGANDVATPCIVDGDDDGHARMTLLLQAHPLHHIALCHKVTPMYLMQM